MSATIIPLIQVPPITDENLVALRHMDDVIVQAMRTAVSQGVPFELVVALIRTHAMRQTKALFGGACGLPDEPPTAA